MAIPKIEQLDTLINKYVGKYKDIVDTKCSRLTAAGENYGSEILKVDLVLKSLKTGKTEDLNIVAKLIPSSEFFKTMFNVQVTFKNEKGFYDTIVPTLHEFQKKQGVQNVTDIFAEFFGARCNLKNDDNGAIDNDAAVILENLAVKGYINVDRHIGYNLPTTIMVLKHLAEFHAVPIALKHKDPKTFETKVKAFMACFHPQGPKPPSEEPVKKIIELLESSEKCRHLIPKIRKSLEHFTDSRKTFKEPLTTLVHRDLWINNIMIKFNDDSPTSCKFVDFQLFSYDSPASDLLFFLFTSVDIRVLKKHLDYLLQAYYQTFLDTLRSLNCNVAFSYKDLLDEILFSAEWELTHVVFMNLFVVHLKKGGLSPSNDNTSGPDLTAIIFEESTVEKILWILEEWDTRGWLKF